MEYSSHNPGRTPADVQVAHFRGESGVDEYHLLTQAAKAGVFRAQLEWVQQAYHQTLATLHLSPRTTLLRRFFCRDLEHHAAALAASQVSSPDPTDEPCAVSWVGQPPAPPAEVALWAYHVRDSAGELDARRTDATLTWRRGSLTHHWTAGLTYPHGETSADQTRGIFEQYDALLRVRGLSLADHVVRTWLFVRDIRTNYAGMVAARREFFRTHGLTPDTHFIASTGIDGTGADPAALVTLDAYAIAGVRLGQIEYLAALDHLGPTHVYGVTFERGTAVSYRDRRHVIISGTASIDPQGEILHRGDAARQTGRTLENVAALLQKAGARFSDIGVLIAYVRDPGDLPTVRQQIRTHCGPVPTQLVVAPVCRPGWLVEIEALAITPATQPNLPSF